MASPNPKQIDASGQNNSRIESTPAPAPSPRQTQINGQNGSRPESSPAFRTQARPFIQPINDTDDEDDTIPDPDRDTVPNLDLALKPSIPSTVDLNGPLLVRSRYAANPDAYEWVTITAHGQYRLGQHAKSPSIIALYNSESSRFLVKKGAIENEQFGRYSNAVALIVASRGTKKLASDACPSNTGNIFVQTIVAVSVGNGACAGCRWSEKANKCKYAAQSGSGTTHDQTPNQTPARKRRRTGTASTNASSPLGNKYNWAPVGASKRRRAPAQSESESEDGSDEDSEEKSEPEAGRRKARSAPVPDEFKVWDGYVYQRIGPKAGK